MFKRIQLQISPFSQVASDDFGFIINWSDALDINRFLLRGALDNASNPREISV